MGCDGGTDAPMKSCVTGSLKVASQSYFINFAIFSNVTQSDIDSCRFIDAVISKVLFRGALAPGPLILTGELSDCVHLSLRYYKGKGVQY